MSLTSSLQRIVQAKADIKTAIENKGVTVGDDVSIADYDDYIDAIQTGSSTPTQTKTVALSMASGDQVISPDTGYALSQVTVEKPSTLIATNIKDGVTIGGVIGSYSGGVTVDVPPVTNLTYTSTGILSWDAPSDLSGISGLSTYNPVISYLVDINGNQYTTSNTYLDISLYLQNGTNTIKVYTVVKLTNDEFTQIIYSRVVIETLTATLYRETMGVGVAGTDVYILGGRTYSNSSPDNKIFKLDTTTSTITTLQATTNGAVAEMGCATVGTKIYLIGGFDGNYLQTIRYFDTSTEATASILAGLFPIRVGLLGAGAVGTDIYLFGGYNGNIVNTIYKFDTITETITTLPATIPSILDRMGVGVVGTNCYIFGGYNGSSFQNKIYKFDSTTNTISTLNTTIPTVLDAMGVGVVGTDIYLFGGRNAGGSYKNTIYKFDTTTDTISTVSFTLSQARSYLGVGVIGTNCYLIGGRPNKDIIEKFYG